MKKIYLILISLFILVAAGYLYVRYKVLRTKDFKPDTSKAASPLDLRPAFIARLQQLVKDGSDGLYTLSIGELNPDLLSSTIEVRNAALMPDSAVLSRLHEAQKAPDDVFNISFSTLNINGIGIQELLNTDKIDIKTIRLTNPVVNIYHTSRPYNKKQREKNDSLTLYQKIMGHMKRISIDTIQLEHGTFVNHNISKDRRNRFNDVSIIFSNVLVDSSTQYERHRFLFASEANITFRDYILATPDSLYYLKAGLIHISTARHGLTAFNVALTARGNREQFRKKLKHRQDMFNLTTPKVTLDEIDWYSLLNEDKLIIKEGTIENCDFNDYFDRSLPLSKTTLPKGTFPHQLLMKMALPVYVEKINLRNCSVTYEEFSPSANASGIITFKKLNGQLSNLTNMPEYVRRNGHMKLSATALFLNKVNFNTLFDLDLKNYKKGNFTVDATLGSIDNTLINPVAEPLGLISLKKADVKKVSLHVRGTNGLGTGKLLLLYDDLHLVPLKKEDNKLKKRGFTSFLANLLVIKKANPSRGKTPREEPCNYKKDDNGSFFNFIWKIILTGILKTVGIPVQYAYK